MATLKIEIEMDNEAFSDGNAGREVRRILRHSEDKISTVIQYLDSDGEKLRDVNGNTVGFAKVED